MEDVKEDSKEKMAQTLEDFHRAGATAQYELNAVSTGIKEYTKEKMTTLSEQMVNKLQGAMNKSEDAVKHIEENTKAGTMSIVSSSLSKTADWLTKISNKIQNK